MTFPHLQESLDRLMSMVNPVIGSIVDRALSGADISADDATRLFEADGADLPAWTPGAHIDLILGVGELAISDHRSSQPTLDDLLKAMLIVSANDACLAAIEHVGGDESQFVGLMNDKAAALGLQHAFEKGYMHLLNVLHRMGVEGDRDRDRDRHRDHDDPEGPEPGRIEQRGRLGQRVLRGLRRASRRLDLPARGVQTMLDVL